jgi:mannitol/fructose-specific phosphotransferase system IIA component (Ntr-type)
MRLTDILQADCVKVPIEATVKDKAIFELVDLLADRVGIDQREQLKKAVWAREMTRTTGIGHGVGIPHGKVEGVAKLCMAIGKSATPIEYGSIDRRPVDLILLLVSPVDQTGPHIQALAAISRMLTDTGFRGAIRAAVSSAELYRIICEHEAREVVS